MWVGKSRAGISVFWADILATDLLEKVNELKIPVYIFEGIYDYACSYKEAKNYFEKLKAPIKGFYTFGKSVHSPIFEEPLKVREIIAQDALRGGAGLADKNS